MDHHHADVKTASKVRFAEPGAPSDTAEDNDAPSPPLTDSEDKDKDDKVNIVFKCFYVFALSRVV